MMSLRRWTALLGAMLCLLLCACGEKAAETPAVSKQDSVTVWCLEEDPLRQGLEAKIEEYNRQRSDGLLPVSLRCFPEEESLAAAFEAVRPDLLLCAYDRAAALEENGALQDLRAGLGEAAPRYPAQLTTAFEGIGRSYYPLGIQVPLLYAGEEAAIHGDWESLCRTAAQYAREQGRAYFAAESFGDVFYQSLLSRQVEFHGDPDRDEENLYYISLYNLLADAAFEGGLALQISNPAELTGEGRLPCAAVWSTELTDAPEEGFTFAPLPGTEPGEELMGRAWGLAVIAREGRGQRSTTGFLRWLFQEGRGARLALDCGLVPAPLGERPQANGALEQTLLEIGQAYSVHLPDPDGDFRKNRQDFERFFRSALARFL